MSSDPTTALLGKRGEFKLCGGFVVLFILAEVGLTIFTNVVDDKTIWCELDSWFSYANCACLFVFMLVFRPAKKCDPTVLLPFLGFLVFDVFDIIFGIVCQVEESGLARQPKLATIADLFLCVFKLVGAVLIYNDKDEVTCVSA